MGSNPEEAEYIELVIEPIPPDTLSSVKANILPVIKAALHEAGQDQLLIDKQMQVEVEQTWPTDEVIVVGFTLLSAIALETFKAILPALKKRFKTWQKRRQISKRKK